MGNFDLKSYLKNNPLLTEGIDLPSTYTPERDKEYEKILRRRIQDYIKGGSKGDIWFLNRTSITTLPDNLTKVGGNLWLSGAKITSLPDNLKVNNILDLDWSKITSLPNNLEVGGSILLRGTPLSQEYTEEEIRKMIEEKGGSVGGISV